MHGGSETTGGPKPKKQVLHYANLTVTQQGDIITVADDDGVEFMFAEAELKELFAALMVFGLWNKISPTDTSTVHYRGDPKPGDGQWGDH